MSKNVAVFVDVANIFYAAKAAGVDIDYVTLLRAAVSGRDFVRAYAYTGLDPENENQRQFHAFLARNGYKVVSKDIRKYGDGKVKANLDIELVVDMMKTARNLDVAVVVSGDGDFAPAIRAVQEMGVRVEVISFRGNTSSDLIEVADVFTDITQIARVERGSSRSGRRVAASDEDLSMTEVPDKETEGAPRRRRSRTRTEPATERPVARRASAEAPGAHGPLVVLPGEKLRRAAGAQPAADEPVAAADEAADEADELAGGEIAAGEAADEDQPDGGRRRRRRRGGRGRGRGRGLEGAPVEAVAEEAAEEEEEEVHAAPRIPAHSTFGSVWDSQLGMPTVPVATPEAFEEGDEEEPEIPEYLLAERRQRGRGGRGHGRGGARSAYQQAMDRERYGRSAGQGGTPAGPRREPRERGSRPGGPGRPDRGRQARPSFEPRPAPGGDPWSEVPPELEEMLRAELARKTATGPASGPSTSGAPAAQGAARPGRGRGGRRQPTGVPQAEEAFAVPAGRTGTPAETPAATASAVEAGPAAGARRGRRGGAGRPPATQVAAASAEPEAAATAVAVPARRRRQAAPIAPEGAAAETAGGAAAEPAPRPRRGRVASGTSAKTATTSQGSAAGRGSRAPAAPAAEPAEAPARRRGRPAGAASERSAQASAQTEPPIPAATTRRRRGAHADASAPDAAAAGAPNGPSAPRRRVTRRAPAPDVE